MSDLESKKLEDSELEDVNGGGFFSNLVFRPNGDRQAKFDTLLQEGNNDWEPDTLEQKKGFRGFRGKKFFGSSGNTSKL